MFVFVSAEYQKVQIGNDQEKAQSRGGEKTKLAIRYLYLKKTYRKPSEQPFPKRRLLSYANLMKTMKRTGSSSTKIRLQNTKQIEPQQKYRRGTISNIKLLEGLKP